MGINTVEIEFLAYAKAGPAIAEMAALNAQVTKLNLNISKLDAKSVSAASMALT